MRDVKLLNYLHMHLLVFIAGFTAILGELITIDAIPLVWFRMLMATGLMYAYIRFKKIPIKVSPKTIARFSFAGIIIALHWITFFGAIKVSNISITLSMVSSGAFFASILEPIIHKRKIIKYEMVFGLVVVLGVIMITQSELQYINGIILGIISAFLSALFAVLNGKFVKEHRPSVISIYEFISGVLFITLFIALFGTGFNAEFFSVSTSDLWYLFILASVCTAYAFIASVKIMEHVSPYTVMLSFNLEPIYGIILAIILFPETEKMSTNFYFGACIILGAVVLNGILKNWKALKRKRS
ncbi:DMT family transporter [Formosa algae]|uniref:Drug/metabolite transporter (DMT)-like permease n=1 Tax=Formosa algae TaxID=225843 RepID=A0A9X0YPL7_9FLAO|nr:DMT family transporter [Formosa algae]MBP1841364.1 drug/metabolite transporter (DMT)-like permease [Formosa algae]MDQ0336714.1 drug/metabolite transporter (DMT)-like permease [Formosa algae]OEI78794.1 permease [Formosa algae]